MTPCYTRHETAPGTHVDIPHEHENGKPMNQSFKEVAALLYGEPSQYEIERAKVLATLAVADEQRTANLIGLAELQRKDRASGPTAASTAIIMIIEDRLDIGL